MSSNTNNWNEVSAETKDRLSPSEFLIKQLPGILRFVGTVTVLFALYRLMLQTWGNDSEVLRYLSLLGYSGLIAAIGLISSCWLNENKGARLLLTLALVSVPVNFAILGAFVYSYVNPGYAAVPVVISWHMDSPVTLLMIMGGALVVLIPMIFLGFRVLASAVVGKLSLWYLLSSALLLIPVRDAQIMSAAAFVLFILLFSLSKRLAASQVSLKTGEGKIALSLQILPTGILLGRSLIFYSSGLFQFVFLSAMLFVLLRQASFFVMEVNGFFRNLLEKLSVIPALFFGFSLATALGDMASFPPVLIFPLSALGSTIMLYELSTRASSSSGTYRGLASIILVLSFALTLWWNFDFENALLNLLAGTVAMGAGYKLQQQSLFVSGVVISGLGLSGQCFLLALNFDVNNWYLLAIPGVLTIFAASMIESRGQNFRAKLIAVKEVFLSWEK